jgi:hypothetical protein
MKAVFYTLYWILQWTWGLPQNLLGLFLALKHRRCKKEWYHGALVTYHKERWGGISLGMFILIKENAGENWIHEAKIHEYGHSIQSLILGPLYLLVIGLPSFLWCKATGNIIFGHVNEYYEFYPESWANSLGQHVTGQKMRLND